MPLSHILDDNGTNWAETLNEKARQKIVLYNPYAVFFTMPLGLLAVGSALDPDRYEICIVDGRLEEDPVARVLEEIDDALCLGVSVLTGAPLGDALKILRAAKAHRPDLPTVCGGWHPSLFPTQMLEDAAIDYSVQGQGETTFQELVDCLATGNSVDDVAGIAHRKDGKPVRNKPRATETPASFRPPDFDLIDVEDYFKLKGERQMDYITSVGCHFRCAFCADPFVYGRTWHGLEPDFLDSEIDSLWQRYRFTDLNFQDETFFTYKKRVAGIAEAFIRRGSRFTWAATMRADQGVRLPRETFEACVESGMRRVLIGVETGSPEMMKRIRKDTTVEQVLQAARMCADYGVAVIFSFIIGFPGETAKDVAMTLDLVKRLRSMSDGFETPVFYYKPYPGSSLSEAVGADLPESLDDWATFDYVQGVPGPWVAPETYRLVERFKFYNRYAWGRGRTLTSPLRTLARLRCRHDLYGAPFEKTLMDWVRPQQQLS